MTVERLREVHRARPFVPYTIHVADGRQIRIGHPDVLGQIVTWYDAVEAVLIA